MSTDSDTEKQAAAEAVMATPPPVELPPLPKQLMYYVTENGVQQGPISEAELKASVDSGARTQDVLVWAEGMEGWKPYKQLFTNTAPKVPAWVTQAIQTWSLASARTRGMCRAWVTQAIQTWPLLKQKLLTCTQAIQAFVESKLPASYTKGWRKWAIIGGCVVVVGLMGVYLIAGDDLETAYKKGLMYQDVKNEPENAVEYYTYAAERGHAGAQFSLGDCYLEGYGVTKSYTEAAKWYRKSAEQGHAEAQFLLGACYDKGFGVTKSYTEAAKWYRKSAEQGNADAQFFMGQCYGLGRGVPRSYTEAVKWWRRAAASGHSKASEFLRELEESVNEPVENDAGTAAEKDASSSRSKKSDAEAEYRKGQELMENFHTMIDATPHFKAAAELGHAEAQYSLGICYEQGRGVTQSYTEAVKWYRRSAEQGVAWAHSKLGECYEEGRGVPPSDKEAAKWYKSAAELGGKLEQWALGNRYADGRVVPQSDTEAAKWWRKAAEQGFASAQTNLGKCYEEGRGVPQSDKEAVKWFRKAAASGHKEAAECLRRLGY